MVCQLILRLRAEQLREAVIVNWAELELQQGSSTTADALMLVLGADFLLVVQVHKDIQLMKSFEGKILSSL